jgi:hypothetical protein
MAEDITQPETLVDILPDELGTGIYWFVDPQQQYEQIFIPKITIARSHILARDFSSYKEQFLDAYRWVPESFLDAAALMTQKCGGKCNRHVDCVDSACRCIRGECRRK